MSRILHGRDVEIGLSCTAEPNLLRLSCRDVRVDFYQGLSQIIIAPNPVVVPNFEHPPLKRKTSQDHESWADGICRRWLPGIQGTYEIRSFDVICEFNRFVPVNVLKVRLVLGLCKLELPTVRPSSPEGLDEGVTLRVKGVHPRQVPVKLSVEVRNI